MSIGHRTITRSYLHTRLLLALALEADAAKAAKLPRPKLPGTAPALPRAERRKAQLAERRAAKKASP